MKIRTHLRRTLMVALLLPILIWPSQTAAQAGRSKSVNFADFEVAPPPKIPLKVVVSYPDSTCQMRVHLLLDSAAAGKGICAGLTRQLQSAFDKVQHVTAWPYTAQPGDDVLILVAPPKGSMYMSGLASNGVRLSLTLSGYSSSGTLLASSSTEMSVGGCRSGKDFEMAYVRMAQQATNDLLLQLQDTPFIREATKPPPPKPIAPPPPVVGGLQVVSTPPGAQVYVNDEFRGVTSQQEGRLAVSNLPAGTYRVRLSHNAYKDWQQPIAVVAGVDTPVAAALQSAGPKPLTEPEIEHALSGMSKARVKKLVSDYGVDFALNDGIERRLRAAGADDELLLTIVKNKK